MASYIVYFTYTDNNGRQAEINSGPYTFEEAKQMRREYEQFAADGTKGTAQIKKIGTDTTSWYHMESKFIKASDDWYPNYPDGTIKLKILAGYNKYSSYVRMVAAGMDTLVGAAVVLLGAGVGVLGSTINPFAVGAAVSSLP